MAQLLNAATLSGVSVFNTVTSTVGSVETLALSASSAANVLLDKVQEWEEDSRERSIATRVKRRKEYVNEGLIAIARRQKAIAVELKQDPELAKLFQQLKADYDQELKAATK